MKFRECLKSKQFSNKFLIKLSLAFANEVKHLVRNPKILKALELTEKWYNDSNSVTIQELRDAASSTYTVAINDDYTAASVCIYISKTTFHFYHTNYNVSYDAANAADCAAKALKKDEKWKFKVLKSCMSKFEREMFNLD